MRTFFSWSTAASIFFSLSVTQSAFLAVAAPRLPFQLAAAGNAQLVQHELAALASATGSPAVLPPAPLAVAGKAAIRGSNAAPTERLDAGVAWVLAHGKPAHLGSNMASALGIPATEDLPVIGKGYRTDDGVIHAFQVSTVTARTEIIIYRRIGDSGVIWRVTRAGAAIATVMVDQDVHVVPNDQYAAMLAAELAYWDTKVPPAPAQAAVGTN